MKRSLIPCLCLGTLALAGVMFLMPATGITAEPAEPQLKSEELEQAIPDEAYLPQDLPDNIGDKKKLLQDLYDQLSKAPGAEDAEVVTSAIERLWMRSGSDTVDLLMDRTSRLMEDKKYDIALDILDSVIELEPEYPEVWTRRAAVLFAERKFEQSLESLRHALALDPSHYKAIEGLGLLMQELGDKESALKAYRNLLKVHPHLEDALQTVKELSREVEGQGI